MRETTFQRFCDIAYGQAGICLSDKKRSLVENRIGSRMRELGIQSGEAYLELLQGGEKQEIISFLDAISTNYTYFFREKEHFAHLECCLSHWYQQGQKRFRIWCAAASTGEEPYSIGITCREVFHNHPEVDFKILATDISLRALQRARLGVYSKGKLQRVPATLQQRYFRAAQSSELSPKGKGPFFKVRNKLFSPIRFKRLNLALPPVPMSGPLDVIFVRNVMIYFDTPVKQYLITEVVRLLKPGGILVIGHSESIRGIEQGLQLIRPSVYIKPE